MKSLTKTRSARPASLATPPGGHVRATIVDFVDGQVVVMPLDHPAIRLRCDVLCTGAPLRLQPGDSVLALWPASADQNGIVLGLIGAYATDAPPPAARPPAKLNLEAVESIALQCGESSIELRKDGKVLISGVDVLSRAKRTQRIKGGSVAIN